ncbi:c-type cytochrome [Parvibaculum sp.]|uniref:c-type cytochrome n=1 Tax=Parvibaculum sp. TaxID=2024848 RepID=UPI00320E42F0
MHRPWKIAVIAVLAGLALTGCGKEDEAAKPVRLDERLADIYGRTCQTCHQNAETGAPLAHDLAAWKPRLAQGEAVLGDHIINGFKGMPPLGQCIECSADDLITLMRFMAAPAPESTQEEEH